MIEFQAAPNQDATDLRVMLEEEREARERFENFDVSQKEVAE